MLFSLSLHQYAITLHNSLNQCSFLDIRYDGVYIYPMGDVFSTGSRLSCRGLDGCHLRDVGKHKMSHWYLCQICVGSYMLTVYVVCLQHKLVHRVCIQCHKSVLWFESSSNALVVYSLLEMFFGNKCWLIRSDICCIFKFLTNNIKMYF